jgi:hypothetical protein
MVPDTREVLLILDFKKHLRRSTGHFSSEIIGRITRHILYVKDKASCSFDVNSEQPAKLFILDKLLVIKSRINSYFYHDKSSHTVLTLPRLVSKVSLNHHD